MPASAAGHRHRVDETHAHSTAVERLRSRRDCIGVECRSGSRRTRLPNIAPPAFLPRPIGYRRAGGRWRSPIMGEAKVA